MILVVLGKLNTLIIFDVYSARYFAWSHIIAAYNNQNYLEKYIGYSHDID